MKSGLSKLDRLTADQIVTPKHAFEGAPRGEGRGHGPLLGGAGSDDITPCENVGIPAAMVVPYENVGIWGGGVVQVSVLR